ncbi:MAG: ATP-binding cassette domain-containing protein [Dehalococcoidales bacterium]|nr:ATP-binding cassette domain-containing protein [Dehalococcoidales bacterium]
MIEIQNLTVSIGDFSLNNLDLTIRDREYFVILGPSGAGKTIFLECLAGLHKLKKGRVLIDNRDITTLAPEERGIGYVPQDYVLFPFLDVRENILFGLKRGKHRKIDMNQRMVILADLLGISHLLDRDINTLSGGEKQRVALARALAPSPRILLMDEPFSSLDVQTAKYLRTELRRIHRELGVTTLHITHNHTEAEELADRMAVMYHGRIEQVGKPQEIFFFPQTEAVSNFIGSLNILDCCSCRQLVPGLIEVDCDGMHIILPHDEGVMQKIAISPRDVYVSDILPPGPSVNRFKGTISAVNHNTSMASMEIRVMNSTIRAEMPGELAREMDLVIGKDVYIILKLRRLKVLGGRVDSTPEQYEWYYKEII